MGRTIVKTDRHVIEDAVIAEGTSVTGVLETNGLAVIAIEMPDEWTAANVAFRAGGAAEMLLPVYDSSGLRVIASVAAGRYIAIPMSDACWGPYMQLEAINDAGIPVSQAAARPLRIHLKSYLN